MVGNIGISFAKPVAVDPKKLYVVEVSSFQLDDIKDFRAEIAVLLNITEDHLTGMITGLRITSTVSFRVIENQTNNDYFIYCEDDEVIMQNSLSTIHTNPLPFSMKHEVKKRRLHQGRPDDAKDPGRKSKHEYL